MLNANRLKYQEHRLHVFTLQGNRVRFPILNQALKLGIHCQFLNSVLLHFVNMNIINIIYQHYVIYSPL